MGFKRIDLVEPVSRKSAIAFDPGSCAKLIAHVAPIDIPMNPRAIREQIIEAELTRSIRESLLCERKEKNSTAAAYLKHKVAQLSKAHVDTATPVPNPKSAPITNSKLMNRLAGDFAGLPDEGNYNSGFW